MDKVGDLLIRIKNGYMASNKEALAYATKLNLAILDLLKREGFIENFTTHDNQITITLKYEGNKPAMTDVRRISKPGRRVYSGYKGINRVYEGLGIAVVSTPKGIMSDQQARKEGVGGEVMAYVW